MRKIRVLVCEDSFVFRQLLVRNLEKDPMIEVVAVAGDPFEARDQILKLHPDVMTLDIELPRMNGLDFLRKLMPQYPMETTMTMIASIKISFLSLSVIAICILVFPPSYVFLHDA